MAKSNPIYVGDLWRGGNTIVGTFDKRRLKVRRCKQPFQVNYDRNILNAIASCAKRSNLVVRCLDDFQTNIDGTEVELRLCTLRLNRHYYLAIMGGFQTGIIPKNCDFLSKRINFGQFDNDYNFRLLDVDPNFNQWFSFYYIMYEEGTFVGRYDLTCVSDDLKSRTVNIPVLVRFNKEGEVVGVFWNDVFGVVRGSKYYDKTLAKYFIMRDY